MLLTVSTGPGKWLVLIPLLGFGAWLVIRRDKWAREVYMLEPLGRIGPIIAGVVGALAITAVIWAVFTSD